MKGCTDYKDYENRILRIWITCAPRKQKLVWANEVPCMTKTLRKAIANRSRLKNRYYKYKSGENLRAYKKQKYYTNLAIKKDTDSKKFCKTVKPFF